MTVNISIVSELQIKCVRCACIRKYMKAVHLSHAIGEREMNVIDPMFIFTYGVKDKLNIANRFFYSFNQESVTIVF